MIKEEITLPDFDVEEVYTSFSQTYDWGLKYSNIPDTWKVSKGKGITIAVIDTGMPDHKDIGDNAVEGGNYIPTEDIYDYNGHQTHCVGIISAKDNQEGFVGVAPESKCVCYKALSTNGGGTYGQINAALRDVIKLKPDLVSMSLGGRTPNAEMHKLIIDLYKMNIPVVCAAGNSGARGVCYPAAFPETIAIAAFNKLGMIASFSSRGSQVDWAAPGADIYSTYLNQSYASLSGTSMACPFMAGVIALMIAKHKEQEKRTGKNDCKTVQDIKDHLLKYTNDKGSLGKDDSWGYGVVDVQKLLATTTTTSTTPKPTTTTPAPKKEKGKSILAFLKKHAGWVMFGAFLLCALGVFLYSCAYEESEEFKSEWTDF